MLFGDRRTPPSSGALGSADLLLLPLRPEMDEALAQRHGVLGGDALGVLALGQPAGFKAVWVSSFGP
jgi:hypothetical protein